MDGWVHYTCDQVERGNRYAGFVQLGGLFFGLVRDGLPLGISGIPGIYGISGISAASIFRLR